MLTVDPTGNVCEKTVIKKRRKRKNDLNGKSKRVLANVGTPEIFHT